MSILASQKNCIGLDGRQNIEGRMRSKESWYDEDLRDSKELPS